VLEAASFGYEPARAEVAVDSAGIFPLDFPLAKLPSGSLEGYVTGCSGGAAAGARVEVLGTPVPAVETDESGFYRFESLPADTYFVIGVSETGCEPYRRAVRITAGETLVLDVTLSAGFFDDVEEGGATWTHYPVTPGWGDEWHVSEEKDHTAGGFLSWKCGAVGEGSYGDHLDAALETPPAALDGGKELLLWHWMDLEVFNDDLAWDGAVVEMSLDGGEWIPIEPATGYGYLINSESGGPFPDGTPCLSGSHDWELLRFDLRGTEGSARFRFRMGTDGSASKEGWYIDDIMLADWRFLEVFAAPPEDSLVAPGDTLEFGGFAQNLTAEEKEFEGRVDAVLEGYRRTVLGPKDFIRGPYGLLHLPHLRFPVPAWAPPVTLRLELIAYESGGEEIAWDSFVVSVMSDEPEQERMISARQFLSRLPVLPLE
jgi:hypothetical protein